MTIGQSTAPPAAKRRLSPELMLAIVLALASVVLRSRALDWGLPDLEEEAFPLKKAFEMCGWGTGTLHLNPGTAGWPSLSFYVQMIVQHLQYWLGSLTGDFADRGDYFLQQMTWTPVAIWARWVSVLCASLVVFVGARLGGRLAGWGGALITGVILLASPMLTRQAHLINPDILVVLFAALALERIIDVEARGHRSDYLWAGIWIGLGISAKYTPLLLALVLYLAHLLRLRREGFPLARWGLDERRLWWAALACVAAFALTSPFVLYDLHVLGRDVFDQVTHLKEGHFGHEAQSMGLVFYIRDVLGPGVGWPALILGLLGLVVAAVRLRGPWLITLASFVVFYVLLSLLKTRFNRYMLPALLPLALGAVGGWAVMAPWLRVRGRLVATTSAAVLMVAVIVPPGLTSLRLLTRYERPSTLQEAKTWLLQHRAKDGLYVAMELYSPSLPRAKQIALRRNDPAFGHLSPAQKQRWLDLDPAHVVYLPFYVMRKGGSDFYYNLRHYLDYEFVVTSSTVRKRYEASPQLYPRQLAFYQALDRYLPQVMVFAPGVDRRGPEIRIYTITPAVREHLATVLPPVTQETFHRAVQTAVGSHFQDFVKTVAEQAAERGDTGTAAKYYQPLYETMPPRERVRYLPPYATVTVQAKLWSQAEPLLKTWRGLEPNNPLVAGYLGLTEVNLGHPEQGLVELNTCLRLAGDEARYAELVAWAQRQVANLNHE